MFDFARLIADGDRYNFHSHTQFCDGHSTMAVFAATAARRGFKHYGFSPHSPLPFRTPCNMPKESVEPYLTEVQRLRRVYPGLCLYAGMEIDYLGDAWGPSNQYFRELPLDYRIGSVHFIPAKHQPDKEIDIDGPADRFARYMDEWFDGDIRYVVETFFERSLAMVRMGGLDMIGHLDKVGHNGGQYYQGLERMPWYRECLDALVNAVIDSGMAVEINTKALAGAGRIFPAEHVVARLRRAGVTLVVNSDAHYADLIDAGRRYGLSLI